MNLAVSQKSVGGKFKLGRVTSGLIPLQVFLPPKCIITKFIVNTIVAPVPSGGATNISFLAGSAITLMPVTDSALFVAGTVLPGVDFNSSPTGIGLVAQQIFINISAPLSAGEINFVCEYEFGDFAFNGTQVINPPPSGAIPFGNDTDASGNAIQVAIPGATLTDDYTFEVRNLTTNTGATTLQINALGAKAVVDSDGNALTGGELINGEIYLFAYDLANDRYELLGLSKTGIGGGGTNNRVAKFVIDGQHIANSQRTDDGTDITDNVSGSYTESVSSNKTVNANFVFENVVDSKTSIVGNNSAETVGNDKTLTTIANYIENIGIDKTENLANDLNQTIANNKSTSITNFDTKTVGQDKTVTTGNDLNENVGHDKNEITTNHKVTSVGQDWDIQVTRDKREDVLGSVTETYHTDKSETISNDSSRHIVRDETITVGRNRLSNISGDDTDNVTGSKTQTSGTTMNVNAGTDYDLTVNNDVNESITNDKNVTVGNSIVETIGVGGKTENVTGNSTEAIGGKKQITATAVNLGGATLQEFATNAAAILGGLVVGDLYRTTVAGDAFVKIVI